MDNKQVCQFFILYSPSIQVRILTCTTLNALFDTIGKLRLSFPSELASSIYVSFIRI